jgi:hypothetical protein
VSSTFAVVDAASGGLLRSAEAGSMKDAGGALDRALNLMPLAL